MFKLFLNKTFGIRDGEIYISFLMQLYIFLIITVLLIVKPTINALFLSNLGADSLPYGYLLVASIAIITTYVYNKAIKRFSLLKVTIISLVVFSLSFFTLCLVLRYSILNTGFLYLYYIGVSLFAVIATSQFWVLANMIFNSREAKRVFGFIGAGAIAGGVFGGYLTSIIASTYNNITAIFIAAILILCCIPIIRKIWTLRIEKMNSYTRKQRKYNDSTEEQYALQVILKSKHLTYLALITGIGVIVAKLIDFQFSDFANKAFSDTDELASFFGFWFSTFNVVALAIQLFLTNRFLSALGVSSTLLVLPLGMALGSLLFIVFPELWVLIIIKGIDGSFKQSLNKAAVELSIMPIPFHIKNQAKSFIDVAVDSIATGLAGLMLLLFIKRFDLDTIYITIIVLFFTFVWIVLIYKLREAYFNSFKANIQRNISLESDGNNKQGKDNTIAQSKQLLRTGDEEVILSVLDRLSPFKIDALKAEIIELLNHPSNNVKSEAIKQLYSYDKGTAIEKIKTLVLVDDDKLVYTALEYILEHSTLSTDKFFDAYLDHANEYISGAALLCLGKESVNDVDLASKYQLNSRITTKINNLNSPEGFTRKEQVAKLLVTIAYSGLKKYYSFINTHLNNKNIYIAKKAIKAAGITSEDIYIEPLLDFLTVKKLRRQAINALKNYGSEISKTIIALDKSEDLKPDSKRYIPKVVQSFNSQSAVKVLTRLLKSKDVIIRLESSKSLIRLKSKNENLYFNKRLFRNEIIKESRYCKDTLDAIASINKTIELANQTTEASTASTEILIARERIKEVLEEQLESSLKCIFKLLSLVYDEADIEVSYSGLISNVKEARVNALEFLDNLLQSQLKSKVLPLIEYYIVSENDSDSEDLNFLIMPERVYIKSLLKKRGKRIKLEILSLINVLDDARYLPMVKVLTRHKNKQVSNFSFDIIKQLNRRR